MLKTLEYKRLSTYGGFGLGFMLGSFILLEDLGTFFHVEYLKSFQAFLSERTADTYLKLDMINDELFDKFMPLFLYKCLDEICESVVSDD